MKGTSGRGRGAGRPASRRLKSAKGRTSSQARWLQRQLKDRYVSEAKRHGYRSRAAWKLVWLDDRFHFLKRGAAVLDLGAAPGGWAQVAAERVAQGRIVAIDSRPFDPIDRVEQHQIDVLETPEAVAEAGLGRFDVVLSDMAAPSSGHRATDHLRSMRLCETALDIAEAVLAPGGTYIAKLLQGGTEAELLKRLRGLFGTVRLAKPEASRSESAEVYIVALGYRGAGEDPVDSGSTP